MDIGTKNWRHRVIYLTVTAPVPIMDVKETFYVEKVDFSGLKLSSATKGL